MHLMGWFNIPFLGMRRVLLEEGEVKQEKDYGGILAPVKTGIDPMEAEV